MLAVLERLQWIPAFAGMTTKKAAYSRNSAVIRVLQRFFVFVSAMLYYKPSTIYIE
jgi:hypothetical protein